MQKLLRLISIGVFFILAGCIPSVHPLYTERDLIFDPALLGEWAPDGGKEKLTFTKGAEKEYKLMHSDADGNQGEFIVHLFAIGGRRFLDFYPVVSGAKGNEFYLMHRMPIHTFFRVTQIEPSLELSMMKPEWLEEILDKNPEALRHEKLDGGVLLTAGTKDLQRFVTHQAKTSDAWTPCSPLIKQSKGK